jgi:hypothetical protein
MPVDSNFILAKHQEVQRLAVERATCLHEFVRQWSLEDISACNEGRTLLVAFAEAHPGACRLAFNRGLDGDPCPMVQNLAKWKVYAEHVSACPKCNEV